jgi:hypothetical protein
MGAHFSTSVSKLAPCWLNKLLCQSQSRAYAGAYEQLYAAPSNSTRWAFRPAPSGAPRAFQLLLQCRLLTQHIGPCCRGLSSSKTS